MPIRFVITKPALDMPPNTRVLAQHAQGQYTYATEEEAVSRMREILQNNSLRTLESLGMTDLRVDPCECWPVHFDPKGVYFH